MIIDLELIESFPDLSITNPFSEEPVLLEKRWIRVDDQESGTSIRVKQVYCKDPKTGLEFTTTGQDNYWYYCYFQKRIELMNKTELVNIYQSTIDYIKDGEYLISTGEYELPRPQRTTVYNNPKPVKKDLGLETEISVVNSDTFEAARGLSNPVVLNMASYYQPGGGVEKGSKAQEEDLFRRSTLSASLTDPKIKKEYPLSFLKGIYSKGIRVFRSFGKYNLMGDLDFDVSVISMPAIKNPDKIDQTYIESLKKKIRVILRIAIIEEHTEIVLGAFGCGAYHNPPKEVATSFKEVLEEEEFKGNFKKVIFAIIDDQNSNNNYEIFRKTL